MRGSAPQTPEYKIKLIALPLIGSIRWLSLGLITFGKASGQIVNDHPNQRADKKAQSRVVKSNQQARQPRHRTRASMEPQSPAQNERGTEDIHPEVEAHGLQVSHDNDCQCGTHGREYQPKAEHELLHVARGAG